MRLKKAKILIGKLVKAEITYRHYQKNDIGIIIGIESEIVSFSAKHAFFRVFIKNRIDKGIYCGFDSKKNKVMFAEEQNIEQIDYLGIKIFKIIT